MLTDKHTEFYRKMPERSRYLSPCLAKGRPKVLSLYFPKRSLDDIISFALSRAYEFWIIWPSAAITNAVLDALQVHPAHIKLPLTPERILGWLQQKAEV